MISAFPSLMITLANPTSNRKAKLMRKRLFKALAHPASDPQRVMRRGI